MTKNMCKPRRKPWWVRLLPAGRTAPKQTYSSRSWGQMWFALAVPYRFRRAHRWYATIHRYFWLPCPLCGHEFGGHEWFNRGGHPAQIPVSDWEPGSSRGICPRCTLAGKGSEAP